MFAGQSLARSKDAYVCRAVACDKQGCVSVSSASERKIVTVCVTRDHCQCIDDHVTRPGEK